jgi:hypothetical protein
VAAVQLGDRAKDRKPASTKRRSRKATPYRRRLQPMSRRRRRNLAGAAGRQRRANPREGSWSGGSQIGGTDFARDLVCGGDGPGLALQRIARLNREISPGPLAQSYVHDQPGEIDAAGDAGRNVWRIRLPGGRVDFVCSGLRRCALDFGWSTSSVATISHARCQNSTSRPGGRPSASQRW